MSVLNRFLSDAWAVQSANFHAKILSIQGQCVEKVRLEQEGVCEMHVIIVNVDTKPATLIIQWNPALWTPLKCGHPL